MRYRSQIDDSLDILTLKPRRPSQERLLERTTSRRSIGACDGIEALLSRRTRLLVP